MPDLNELGLNDEAIEGVDFEEMPQGLGSSIAPPQPGIYQFQLPTAEVMFKCFDKDNSDPEQGQRLMAIFRDAAALKNLTLGGYYNTQISNKTRAINFKSGPVTVSDMAMLLKAVASLPQGKNNAAYAQALVNAQGATFMAENRLSITCNSQRDIYKDGDKQDGIKGCGKKYSSSPYTRKGVTVLGVPKGTDGLFLLSFPCSCGADLRVWGNLQGFRKG
jgi:hypothetical protein